MLEYLKISLLSIIEGLTEWLPISSTGHMIIFDYFFPLNLDPNCKSFLLVIIQLGAIIAVIIVYFKELLNKKLWGKIIIATIPAGVLGLFFSPFITRNLYNVQTISVMLIVYGIAFVFVKTPCKENNCNSITNISYLTALKIGMFQSLALIPGTSRSGATIIGGLLCGLNKETSVKFSFLLAIPIMIGASCYKIIQTDMNFSNFEWSIMLFGTIVALIVSLFSIKFLINFVKKNNFTVFGYYRIILGIFLILFC